MLNELAQKLEIENGEIIYKIQSNLESDLRNDQMYKKLVEMIIKFSFKSNAKISKEIKQQKIFTKILSSIKEEIEWFIHSCITIWNIDSHVVLYSIPMIFKVLKSEVCLKFFKANNLRTILKTCLLISLQIYDDNKRWNVARFCQKIEENELPVIKSTQEILLTKVFKFDFFLQKESTEAFFAKLCK